MRFIETLLPNERGVVLRFGNLNRVAGPGPVWLLPLFERMVRVDMRPFSFRVHVPEIEKERERRLSLLLDVTCAVLRPDQAALIAADYRQAVEDRVISIVKEAVTTLSLDELIGDRLRLGRAIKKIANETTLSWGVDVQSVTIIQMDCEPPVPEDSPTEG